MNTFALRSGNGAPRVVRCARPFRIAGAVLVLVAIDGALRAAPIEPRDAVDLVTGAIINNYSQCRTAKVSFTTTSHSPDGAKRTERIKLQDGGVIESSMPARHVMNVTVWISGEFVRADVTVQDSPNVRSYTRKAGIWTEFARDEKQAWIRRENQMPHLETLDPRDMGSLDIRETLLSIVQKSKIVTATLGQRKTQEEFVRLDLVLPRGQEMTYEFDRRFNFLPTLVVLWFEDESVAATVTIDYQRLGDGTAWFFKRAVRHTFRKGRYRAPPQPTDHNWLQRGVTEVTAFTVNDDVPADVFDLDLPNGTHVANAVEGRVHVVGARPPVPGMGTGSLVAFFVTLIAAFSAVGYFLWRRQHLRGGK